MNVSKMTWSVVNNGPLILWCLVWIYTICSVLSVQILRVSMVIWRNCHHNSHSGIMNSLQSWSHLTWAFSELTLSLPQAIIIGFCKQHRSRWDDRHISWSGSTLFDIQSFNFRYKHLSIHSLWKKKNQIWNLGLKELKSFLIFTDWLL